VSIARIIKDMAVDLSNIQAIEQFHLLFLAQLGARLDKTLYALKGGCNLRFFFKSIRYSDDIDFDVRTIAPQTLRKNVRQILDAPGFRRILRAAKLQLTHIAEPKQTTTTQRWKIHLAFEGSGADLPTSIEFSRRRFDPGVVFEPADTEIVAEYNLRPVFASHYDLETAFQQKVGALINRRETQARDIFDLDFLSQRGATGYAIKMDKKKLVNAGEIASSVSYEQFLGQVVAYLPPEYRAYYQDPKSWKKIQKDVVRTLEVL
jgi:predicted nucleotidyltransferase component of viral defense system